MNRFFISEKNIEQMILYRRNLPAFFDTPQKTGLIFQGCPYYHSNRIIDMINAWGIIAMRSDEFSIQALCLKYK